MKGQAVWRVLNSLFLLGVQKQGINVGSLGKGESGTSKNEVSEVWFPHMKRIFLKWCAEEKFILNAFWWEPVMSFSGNHGDHQSSKDPCSWCNKPTMDATSTTCFRSWQPFPPPIPPAEIQWWFFQVFSGRCLWWRQWGRGDEMNAVGAHLGRPPAWSSRFLLAGQAWHQPHWDAPCRVRQLVFELVRTHEWKTSEKTTGWQPTDYKFEGVLGKVLLMNRCLQKCH